MTLRQYICLVKRRCVKEQNKTSTSFLLLRKDTSKGHLAPKRLHRINFSCLHKLLRILPFWKHHPMRDGGRRNRILTCQDIMFLEFTFIKLQQENKLSLTSTKTSSH